MTGILHELRLAVRSLARRPSFTVLAAVTLGLGIGANAAVYSWVRTLLIDPLPWAGHGDRLVEVTSVVSGQQFSSLSYPDFLDLRDRSRTTAGMLAHEFEDVAVAWSGEPERAWTEMVSAEFFQVLEVAPARGRFFHPEEDDVALGAPVAVISHAVWETRFGRRDDVIGTTIVVNDHRFTVVGVAPPGFQGGYSGLSFDLWVPISMQEWITGSRQLEARGNRWMNVLARRAPGVGLAQVRAELAALGNDLARDYPETNDGFTVSVEPLSRSANGPQQVMGPVLTVLTLLVAVVLLIACANVANLLLARGEERRRELAVRLALGAGRRRVARLLILESLAIALLGAAGAVATAWATADLLVKFMPPMDLPVALDVAVDGRVLGFTLLLAVIAAGLFGAVPALQSARTDVAAAIREESRSATAGRGRRRGRSLLVVVQVALSMVLLVSAMLVWRSLRVARAFDPGFEPRNVLLASINLFPRGLSGDEGRQFLATLQERVAALPGVSSASLSRRVPLSFGGSSSSQFTVDGYDPAPGEQMWTLLEWVGVDYFRTMRQPVLQGRGFATTDRADDAPVAVVNRALAERYLDGRDPVGASVAVGDTTLRIVGVVGDVRYRQLDEAPRPMVYLPLSQFFRPDVTVHLRTAGDPRQLVPAVRALVRELDPALPVFNVRTLEENAAAATFQQRLSGTLMGALGGLALLVAAVGLYGLLAHSVARRTHEIGIRLAVGAGRRSIFALVLRDGMRLAIAGLLLGVAIALVLTRAMTSLLFGIGSADPLSYLAAVAVLLLVAGLACLAPARRAVGVEPMDALRYE